MAADFDPTIASFGGSEGQTISSDYYVVRVDFRRIRGLNYREALIRISAQPNSNTFALATVVTFPINIRPEHFRLGLQFAALCLGWFVG